MKTTILSLAAVSLLLASPLAHAGEAVKTYPPAWNNTAGVDLAFISGTFADNGVGIAGYWDAMTEKHAGPGHVAVGVEGLFGSTESDVGPAGCRAAENITHLGVRGRYFLDVHPVIRPWAGIGVGAYSFNRRYRNCAQPVDDDLAIGFPLSLGLDLAFQQMSLSISVNAHTTAPEDFQHVGIGVGWRF